MDRNELLAIIREAEEQYPDSPILATRMAYDAIMAHPDHQLWAEPILLRAVSDLIYAQRREVNKVTRLDNTRYACRARVVVGTSEAVSRVCRSVFEHRIGGKRLGLLTKADLARVQVRMEQAAAGCARDASLCERLVEIMPDEGTVEESLLEEVVRDIYQLVYG